MKNLLTSHPNTLRLIISTFLLAAALIGSGFLNISVIPVGMLLVIIITWLMLRSEGLDFSFIGFDIKMHHLLLIPFGLLLGMASYLLTFYTGVLVRGDHISVNEIIDGNILLKQFWRVLPTTVVQDFIIVGYCYIKLIELTSKRTATIIFGIFFICLHDVWGNNIVNDLFYAFGLFMAYLMFSTAFLHSRSIWLVIGLHWGNNFANSNLFTFSHTKTSWLFISDPHQITTIWQIVGMFITFNLQAVIVIIIIKLIWWRGKTFLGEDVYDKF